MVREGDTVVDATCGNGHDTAALCRMVGASGTVHAFDIQQLALDRTRFELEKGCQRGDGAEAPQLPRVEYHCCDHADMLDVMEPHSASLVVFNLGYLPHGDHCLTTKVESTRKGVLAALQVRCCRCQVFVDSLLNGTPSTTTQIPAHNPAMLCGVGHSYHNDGVLVCRFWHLVGCVL